MNEELRKLYAILLQGAKNGPVPEAPRDYSVMVRGVNEDDFVNRYSDRAELNSFLQDLNSRFPNFFQGSNPQQVLAHLAPIDQRLKQTRERADSKYHIVAPEAMTPDMYKTLAVPPSMPSDQPLGMTQREDEMEIKKTLRAMEFGQEFKPGEVTVDEFYAGQFPEKLAVANREAALVAKEFKKKYPDGKINPYRVAYGPGGPNKEMTADEILNAKSIEGIDDEGLLLAKRTVKQQQLILAEQKRNAVNLYDSWMNDVYREHITPEIQDALNLVDDVMQKQNAKQPVDPGQMQEAIAAQEMLDNLPPETKKAISSVAMGSMEAQFKREQLDRQYPELRIVEALNQDIQDKRDMKMQTLETVADALDTRGFPGSPALAVWRTLRGAAEIVPKAVEEFASTYNAVSAVWSDDAKARMIRRANRDVMPGTFRDSSKEMRPPLEQTAWLQDNESGKMFEIGYDSDGKISNIYGANGYPARLTDDQFKSIYMQAEDSDLHDKSKTRVNGSSMFNQVVDGTTDLAITYLLARGLGSLGKLGKVGRFLEGSGGIASRVRESVPILFQYTGRMAEEGIRQGLSPEAAITYGGLGSASEALIESAAPFLGKVTGARRAALRESMQRILANPAELRKLRTGAFMEMAVFGSLGEMGEEMASVELQPITNRAVNALFDTNVLDTSRAPWQEYVTSGALGLFVAGAPGVLGGISNARRVASDDFLKESIYNSVLQHEKVNEIASMFKDPKHTQLATAIQETHARSIDVLEDKNIPQRRKVELIAKTFDVVKRELDLEAAKGTASQKIVQDDLDQRVNDLNNERASTQMPEEDDRVLTSRVRANQNGKISRGQWKNLRPGDLVQTNKMEVTSEGTQILNELEDGYRVDYVEPNGEYVQLKKEGENTSDTVRVYADGDQDVFLPEEVEEGDMSTQSTDGQNVSISDENIDVSQREIQAKREDLERRRKADLEAPSPGQTPDMINARYDAELAKIENPVVEQPKVEQPEMELTPLQKLEADYESKSVDDLVALKKELYSDVDIESPMSPEEKLLNKVISKKFSDLNQQVRERRQAKKEPEAAEQNTISSQSESTETDVSDQRSTPTESGTETVTTERDGDIIGDQTSTTSDNVSETVVGDGTETKIQDRESPPAPQAELTPQQEVDVTNIENDDALSGIWGDRRQKGEYTRDGVNFTRQKAAPGPTGKKGNVRFTNDAEVPYSYKLIEAKDLQPSHSDGKRNPKHFIPEAQPKPRNDKATIAAENNFASAPRFNELGENTNAYSGAPIVNARGEVIQGNNRSAGLVKTYKFNNQSYKNALAENAEQFGFTSDQVNGMSEPILVRQVDLTDSAAIEYGNYDVKDLETGSKRSLDPVAVSRRMPFNVKSQIAEMLFSDPDLTIKEALRKNTRRFVDAIRPYVTTSHLNTMLKDNEWSQQGINDVEALVKYFMFDGGLTELPELFEKMPHDVKQGISKSLPYIFSGDITKSLVPQIQTAIVAMNHHAVSGAPWNSWLNQADLFNGGVTPRSLYTETELALAELFTNAKKQSDIVDKFRQYAGLTRDVPGDMFQAARPGLSKAEAIKQVFNADYDETVEKAISERRGGQADRVTAAGVESTESSPVETDTRTTIEAPKQEKRTEEEVTEEPPVVPVKKTPMPVDLRAQLEKRLQDHFKLDKAKAQVASRVIDRMFQTMATKENIPLNAMYEAVNFVEGTVFDAKRLVEKAGLSQEVADRIAGAHWVEDGKTLVFAFFNPNVSTPLHEIAHVYQKYLTPEERAEIMRSGGYTEWTPETSEYFARGFERYLAEGEAPSPEMQPIFDKLKQFFLEIYRAILGSPIGVQISPQMRQIYARMLGYDIDPSAGPRMRGPSLDTPDQVGDFLLTGDTPLFQIAGEQGATRLDAASDSNVRMDKLTTARDMETGGMDPLAIRRATGWERGPDGLWKYEINDLQSRIKDYPTGEGFSTYFINKLHNSEWANLNRPKTPEERVRYQAWSDQIEAEYNRTQRPRRKLSEFLDHPELYQAYPELADLTVQLRWDWVNQGAYNPREREIRMGMMESEELFRHILAHEIQHYIQISEGFPTGGSTSQFVDEDYSFVVDEMFRVEEILERTADKMRYGRGLSMREQASRDRAIVRYEELKSEKKGLVEAANKKYRELSGEVEARNVENRISFTEDQRAETLLRQTEDVATEDQSFIYYNGPQWQRSFDPNYAIPELHPITWKDLNMRKSMVSYEGAPEGRYDVLNNNKWEGSMYYDKKVNAWKNDRGDVIGKNRQGALEYFANEHNYPTKEDNRPLFQDPGGNLKQRILERLRAVASSIGAKGIKPEQIYQSKQKEFEAVGVTLDDINAVMMAHIRREREQPLEETTDVRNSPAGEDIIYYNMTTSDETNKMLSGATWENVFGEKPEGNQMYYVSKLNDMLQDGKNMTTMAARRWGTSVLEYGPPLFDLIKKMSDDMSNKKAVLLATFLGELQQEKVTNPSKAREVGRFENQVFAYYQHYMNIQGKRVAAGRLIRLYRDRFLSEIYEDMILEESEIKARKAVEKALSQPIVDRGEGPKQISEAEKTRQDSVAQKRSDEDQVEQKKKRKSSNSQAKTRAQMKANEILSKTGLPDMQAFVDRLRTSSQSIKCP